jgi:HK97 family phage major capsid protein
MLNKKAFAYGKKLIREGAWNIGTEWNGEGSNPDHYLGDGVYPFIAEIDGKDVVFQAALYKVIEEAFEDEEITEAAEELLERIEDAQKVSEGSDLTGGGQASNSGGGGKPPTDSGTSADLADASFRDLPEEVQKSIRRQHDMEKKVVSDGKGRLERVAEWKTDEIDMEAKTVPMSFSSDAPYERYFGNEILGHADGEIRMERVNDEAPYLLEHDTNNYLGKILTVSIDNGSTGRAVVQFAPNAQATEVFNDIASGFRKHVSVGYYVHEMKKVSEATKDAPADFRVVDWEPLEISTVSIPADAGVGVMRGYAFEDELAAGAGEQNQAEVEEQEETTNKPPEKENKTMEETPKIETPEVEKVDLNKVRSEGSDLERKRVANLMEYAEVQKDCPSDILQKAIKDGKSSVEMAKDYMGWKRENTKNANSSAIADEDAKGFSLLALARYLAQPTRENEKAAGKELEMCQAESQRRGQSEGNGVAVPNNIWQRDLTVGTDSAGGYLKPTTDGGLIEMLRPKSHMLQLARVLPGLVGDTTFSTQATGATPYWVAESTAVTESNQTFGQVTLTGKTLGTFTDMSRKALLNTSPSIEQVVREDLLATIATEIDRVCIEGSGTGAEPTGILNNADVITNSVATAAAGEALTWTDVVDIWKIPNTRNADVQSMAWLTSPAVIAHMMTKPKVASTDSNFILNGLDEGLLGFPIYSTNQCPDDLTQSTGTALSALIYGNFADLLIGFWGGLTLNVDDTTLGTQGARRIICLQDMDVAIRHAASFGMTDDIDTSV